MKAEPRTINEQALLAAVRCPLGSPDIAADVQSPVLACTEQTFRWLTTVNFDGGWPSMRETMEVFEHHWHATSYYKAKAGADPREYHRLLLSGVRACRRIRDLFVRFQLIQPARHLPPRNRGHCHRGRVRCHAISPPEA